MHTRSCGFHLKMKERSLIQTVNINMCICVCVYIYIYIYTYIYTLRVQSQNDLSPKFGHFGLSAATSYKSCLVCVEKRFIFICKFGDKLAWNPSISSFGRSQRSLAYMSGLSR
ncbi:hypothetical protein GJAV_G00147440 [Gymnothorax javanicus]|nr:hypothetical protein GJAV_G00147440 [Gymnothorax javanicus]